MAVEATRRIALLLVTALVHDQETFWATDRETM
jgi:hypothetical protein